jgi:hypothetical protein
MAGNVGLKIINCKACNSLLYEYQKSILCYVVFIMKVQKISSSKKQLFSEISRISSLTKPKIKQISAATTLNVISSTHQWCLWRWVRVWGAEQAEGTWWARGKRIGPWGVWGLRRRPEPHHDYTTALPATTAMQAARRRRPACITRMHCVYNSATHLLINRRQTIFVFEFYFPDIGVRVLGSGYVIFLSMSQNITAEILKHE